MRSVFVATGGFLGRIDSETRCAFWADEPVDHGFDASLLIAIDLANTPRAVLAQRISWDAVQVDDCFIGPNGSVSGTTLGPRWPEMQLAGIVCLEEGFVTRIPARLRPACPAKGMSGRDYEYKTVLYWPQTNDPRAGNRYTGHHAEILQEQGTLARLAVFPPASSDRPGAQPMTMWIDLSSADQCDAGRDSLTTIGTGDAPKHGAIFLISGNLQLEDADE